ncbi:hypothetical protein [Pseudomonas serbica]
MAGVKGKGGGARPNSGGARQGAGRKKKTSIKSANESANGLAISIELESQPHGGDLERERAVPVLAPETDMLSLLTMIALGQLEASPVQVRAAIAAVQYTHVKKGDVGKKESNSIAAREAFATGKYRSSAPPTNPLRSVK